MRIKEATIYKFEELQEEIQEKVLNNFREINVDYGWWLGDDYLLQVFDEKGDPCLKCAREYQANADKVEWHS